MLYGHADRISHSGDEDEVVMGLSPGLQLVGFAESALQVKKGDKVKAAIDESAVVIALVP